MIKKKCTVCTREWPETMKHCPSDGARLIALPDGPLVGRTLAGKYYLMNMLGEGASGTVYKAQRVVINDLVAVKTLRPELLPNPVSVERFRREAQAAGRIRHPNAISIYDFGMEDNIAYLVMELLVGRTLRDIMKTDSPLPVRRTVHIFLQICGAVQRAHRSGVIHRDLKPENIMLEEFEGLGETVKVIDFSLAKLKVSGNLMQSLTEKGRVAGTPYYMSPEQWLDKPLDSRADVYSIGVMLYEVLTGFMPFDADTVMELAKKHVQAEPVHPNKYRADLPRPVCELILKSLAKKPENRPQSTLELARELRTMAGLDSDEDALTRQLKRLNPATSTLNGAVIITTSPPGCNVYINNHYVGTTDETGTLMLQGVPMGEYDAAVVRVGYREWEGRFRVESGAATLGASLDPIQEDELVPEPSKQ
jgi:eukaryotic-like serine/threonine-protein kinase